MADSCKVQVKYIEGVKEDLKTMEPVASDEDEGCRGSTRCLIPAIYRKELRELFKLAGPVVRAPTLSPCQYTVTPECNIRLFLYSLLIKCRLKVQV